MIRLGMPKEPRWIDIGIGVRLRIRPVTTAISAMARSEAREMIRRLREDRDVLVAAGLDPANLPDLGSEHVRAGIAEGLMAKILGRLVIVEWTGVLDLAGTAPAAVTPQAIGDLMEMPMLAGSFLRQASEPLAGLVAEGNGSGAAPNGTGAAAPDTARGAETRASPAPEVSA